MTTKLTLTSTPQQVSTGANQVHLAVVRGQNPRYAIGATEPSKDNYYELKGYTMGIPAGFAVWMWAPTAEVIEIVYDEGTV